MFQKNERIVAHCGGLLTGTRILHALKQQIALSFFQTVKQNGDRIE
jgi:hypothetical protein